MFSVATEENRMDEFFEAAKAVSDILEGNEDFDQLMSHPQIIKEDKIKVIEKTFAGKVPKEIIGLMTLMVTKGRAEDILAVFHYFIDLVKEEKKIGKADVTTAIELSAAQKERVEQKLLQTTEYKSFEMCYRVDESLIGGMIIRIGDRVVDSSVKTKLYDLTRNLRKIQV